MMLSVLNSSKILSRTSKLSSSANPFWALPSVAFAALMTFDTAFTQFGSSSFAERSNSLGYIKGKQTLISAVRVVR